MWIIGWIFLFSFDANASTDKCFEAGNKTAEKLKSQIPENIKSGAGKANVPGFKERVSISDTETSMAFSHARKSEAGRAILDIHGTRGVYKFDEKDSLLTRSEEVQKNPEKVLNEVEFIEPVAESYTIEYCEETSDEEYIIKARRIKKRHVYLKTPPCVTASCYCKNHGNLKIKVEIANEPDEIFREDGQFENIRLLDKVQSGAVIDEIYTVNGHDLILRKTIIQDGRPWIHPDCWMVPHLQNQVLDAGHLIRELLGGSEDRSLSWGKLGSAHLSHRVVNDTGEHYWIEDDKCQECERLCDLGLCRYVSMVEDTEMDKYWKGKKVKSSWGQTVTYACRYDRGSKCKDLVARGCEQIGSSCAKTIGGKCVMWKQKYKCRDRIRSTSYKFSGETAFCLDGECIDSSFKSDEDMIEALGYLSILENVRKELKGTNNINIFKGSAQSCTRWILSFKDCCTRQRGWGVDVGFAGCDKDSKELLKQRRDGKCVQVGTYCAEKTALGICIRKKTVFCCFGNKFAKLLQEQGKKQLKKGFGTPESPNCAGFTVEELKKVDFSKLDLSEIANDVMESFKPKLDAKKHFAQGNELGKIRDSMKDLPMMQNISEREGGILRENVKHMTSGMDK